MTMRTREEIEKEARKKIRFFDANTKESATLIEDVPLDVELLLDIRELLIRQGT